MALDGILIHALIHELNEELVSARIAKINQPEPEELLLTLKGLKGQRKLLLSANASLPLAYLTDDTKENPMTAPNFCMLLRKHLGNGRIISFTQPGLERVIDMTVDHLDELGDLKEKHLIIEIMGKHSNIIFADENYKILDSIRRVPPSISTVRTVLPGAEYFIPNTLEKQDALTVSEEAFYTSLKPVDNLAKALSGSFTGISFQSASEFLVGSGMDPDKYVSALTEEEKVQLYSSFKVFVKDIQENRFSPEIAYDSKETPQAFSAFPLISYHQNTDLYTVKAFDSVSELLRTYYREKNQKTNIRQRSQDLRKVTDTLLARAVKKLDLQEKQLKDTEKRERFRLYGDLITAYRYSLPQGGEEKVTVNDWNTGEDVVIPLDPDLSLSDNANNYFEKYKKQKRTFDALSELVKDTRAEIEHLRSIQTNIDIASGEEDLKGIREEMAESGYVKRAPVNKNGKREKVTSKPHHYISSDGFDIYIGKNNLQNDYLTLKFAANTDIFMHAKNAPGSHVIVRTEGREVPDRTYEEGGALAAYYSSLRENEKAEIDYVEVKQVKKPAGAKPGFVIYHTNYSLMAVPDIKNIRKLS